MSDASPRETTPAERFAPTRWTLVLRARGNSAESRAALGELCVAYYRAVQAFIKQTEPNPENALDLTQAFFAQLLSDRGIAGVEPGRARFRSYLLGAVKHFLAQAHRKAGAAKRGGRESPMPLDIGGASETTMELQVPDPLGSAPDTLFDRHWATTLVDRAATVLAAEYADSGRGSSFAVLKPWLLGEPKSLSQAEAAHQLGLSEGAVKVAVHRLRRRFRDLVKAEIGQTVNDPAQVQEELRYLIEVLSQPM